MNKFITRNFNKVDLFSLLYPHNNGRRRRMQNFLATQATKFLLVYITMQVPAIPRSSSRLDRQFPHLCRAEPVHPTRCRTYRRILEHQRRHPQRRSMILNAKDPLSYLHCQATRATWMQTAWQTPHNSQRPL